MKFVLKGVDKSEFIYCLQNNGSTVIEMSIKDDQISQTVMVPIQQMSLISQSTLEEPQIIKMAFKISIKANCLTLKLAGLSQHFLECFDLKSHPQILNLLQDYQICQESCSKIKFCSTSPHSPIDHAPLDAALTQLLYGFSICIMGYGAQQKEKVSAIINCLKQLSDQLRIKTLFNNSQVNYSQVIIFFPSDLRCSLLKRIYRFQRYQKHSLVFSLNFFIRDQINPQFRQRFTQQIAIMYTKQLKALSQNKILKNLSINSIIPTTIHSQNRNQLWSKKEREGIYGLKMEVEGLDYEILKLYSEIELFFSKISYCVKTMEGAFNCTQENLQQKYFQQKYSNKMVKCILLDKKQVAIIGPPEYFQKVKQQLSKYFWTIDHHVYPNLQFSLIQKKQNTFRRYLKDRQIQWEQMVISKHSLTFYSDKSNYQKMKYHCRIFLTQHIEEQFKVDFISNPQDFNIFNEFTLKPSKLQDVDLYCQENVVYCRCLFKLTTNIYKYIKQLYQEHLQALEKAVSLKNINDPLIKSIINPPYLTPQRYIRWRLSTISMNFKITIQDYQSGERQDYAIFMVGNISRCSQLKSLLKERVNQLQSSRQRFREVMMQDSDLFEAIIYWNISSTQYEDFQYKEEKLFQELISIVRNNKNEIKLVITKQLLNYHIQQLYSLLYKLAQSQLDICKRITLILSEELTISQKYQLHKKLIYYFEHQLKQEISFNYIIDINLLQEIISLQYFELTWVYQSEQKNINIKCSPLNSFAFYAELEKTNIYNEKVVIFLPKIKDTVEILLQLHSLRAFEVAQDQIVRISQGLLLSKIQEMATIIRHYFPHQNYIVIYSNKEKNNLISAVYVYSRQKLNKLRKYKIDNTDRKIKNISDKSVSFTLEYQDIDRFRHQTHRKNMAQLRTMILQ